MDKLAPWAEAEIDRLQSRLKLPKTERFELASSGRSLNPAGGL